MKGLRRVVSILLTVALFVTLFSGCSFFIYGGDFVLRADRYYIQPTGSDYPTLFFTTKDGETIDESKVKVYVNGESVRRRRITATEEGTITAYAEYNGMRSNYIYVTAAYNSDLPVIIVDTGKKRVNQNIDIDAEFYLYEPDGSGVTLYGGNRPASVASDCTIRIRGQSSALIYEKKQYKIHLQNEDGSNNNVSLVGLPAENDWIINGTYGDKTVMHNYLAYALESQMSFDWSPRCRFCEVYITSDKDDMKADDYLGLFVLIESVKADSERVDVTKGDRSTAADEIGYIFAKDKGVDRQNAISTSNDTYVLEYPNPDWASSVQKNYLKNKIQTFEDALYGADFTDPEKGYRAYMDVDTYIDAVLLTELMKNVDGVRLSTYFSLDVGGKIKCGPAWDFDISCGTCDYGLNCEQPYYFICLDPTYRYADVREGNTTAYLWLDRMMEDPWFRDRLVERYREYRNTVFAEENIQSIIDEAYGTALAAATRNGQRWPDLYSGKYVWPNAFTFDSYTEAVNDLKTWIHNRLQWLDENIGWVNGEKSDYGKPEMNRRNESE